MPAPRLYLTTTIPYVNARPHLGFALELVQADVLARHRRQRGDRVRFLSGTDDNSLKNVLAAEAEGLSTQELVDRNAAAFEALRGPLALSFDDFIRTSSDPRHRPGVERLWRACAAAGDLYRKHYEGLYCVGCEQFYNPAELREGRCPEHDTRAATNRRGELVLPPFPLPGPPPGPDQQRAVARRTGSPSQRGPRLHRRGTGGLQHLPLAIPRPWLGHPRTRTTLSRSSTSGGTRWATTSPPWTTRTGARTTSGGGCTATGGCTCSARACCASTPSIGPRCCSQRVNPCPPTSWCTTTSPSTDSKLSKSAGAVIDPVALVDQFGTDAVRWWLLREVPRVGDADFTIDKLTARANRDLANDLGNLVHRVVSMLHRYREGQPPAATAAPAIGADRLVAACEQAPDLVDSALAAFDFRGATAAVWSIVEEANRYVEHIRPWHLAKAERDGDIRAAATLDAALDVLVRACVTLAEQLAPFLPDTAARIATQCTPVGRTATHPATALPQDLDTQTKWKPIAPRVGSHVAAVKLLVPSNGTDRLALTSPAIATSSG